MSALPAQSASALAVVERFFAAFGAKDDETLFGEILAPDVEWHVPGDPAVVPWVGRRVGHEPVREFLRLVRTLAVPVDFGVQRIVADGDVVYARGNFAYDFPSSGRSYADEFVMELTVRAGRIAKYRIFEDSYALASAFRS